jgi:hypothetical protein
MSPRFHPLDQFRRDHPLLQEQGQDVGLEQAPQDDGIEDGGMDETSVRPEGPRGSQDMQVGMPVQKLPGGLYGDDGGEKRVPFRVFPEERGKSFPDAQGEFREKPSPVPEGRSQYLGECEDEMPVWDWADHLLPDEFSPKGGAFGGAGRAEPPLFAGEGDEIFVPAGVASYSRETAFGKAAPEEALDRFRDDPPQGAEGPFEPQFVFPGKAVEELVKDGVEGGPLGASWAVEFRFIEFR